MDLGLKDKVAVVTGASKGIGRAVAVSLAREGVKVVIAARGQEALSATEKEIHSFGGEVFMVRADVTAAVDVQNLAATTVRHMGRIDILVHNAGGAERFSDLDGLNDEDWGRAYDLNLLSAVRLTRAALPELRKSSLPRIIFISSVSGLQPGGYNPHYAAAKAAQINFSKYLSNTLARDKILVNTVCAGPVHSHSWDMNVSHVAELRQKDVETVRREFEAQEAAKVPLGRVGEPEDVASVVTFLASVQASWITGSCFHVDGGKIRSIG